MLKIRRLLGLGCVVAFGLGSTGVAVGQVAGCNPEPADSVVGTGGSITSSDFPGKAACSFAKNSSGCTLTEGPECDLTGGLPNDCNGNGVGGEQVEFQLQNGAKLNNNTKQIDWEVDLAGPTVAGMDIVAFEGATGGTGCIFLYENSNPAALSDVDLYFNKSSGTLDRQRINEVWAATDFQDLSLPVSTVDVPCEQDLQNAVDNGTDGKVAFYNTYNGDLSQSGLCISGYDTFGDTPANGCTQCVPGDANCIDSQPDECLNVINCQQGPTDDGSGFPFCDYVAKTLNTRRDSYDLLEVTKLAPDLQAQAAAQGLVQPLAAAAAAGNCVFAKPPCGNAKPYLTGNEYCYKVTGGWNCKIVWKCLNSCN
jgi:hypothetical protein